MYILSGIEQQCAIDPFAGAVGFTDRRKAQRTESERRAVVGILVQAPLST